MSVCLAVVRGLLTPEQAREAILSRMPPQPVQELLRLNPDLSGETLQLHSLPPGERDECLDLFRDLYSQPPGEIVLREDGDAARMLIQQRLVSSDQAEECLGIQRLLWEKGVHPLPRLGELLIKKGYLVPGATDPSITRTAPTADSPDAMACSGATLPASVRGAASDPDNHFGRYVRTVLLGDGGAGEVWKSWDLELERWVALKFLKFQNTEELARLKREAQTAASLSHPGIARVFEIAEARDRTFLALEFVEGQTLETFPRHDHRKLVSLVRDVALAIHYAHGKGVVHRDLKPGNIMVDSSDRAFVMDFGLARQIQSKRSVTGPILGTPAYMPPEQATGGTVEVRSDVYSLGATLYELLSNRPPFQGNNIFETLDKVVTKDPEPLLHVAADLRTIVSKCLAKETTGRYSTAADFAEDLRRWMEAEPILAHPPSVLYRLRKKARKARAVLGVALCGVLAASGVSAWIIPRWLRADRAESLKELELAAEKAERAGVERALALSRPHLDEARRLEARLDRLLTTETWTPQDVRNLTSQTHRELNRVLAISPGHPEALLEKARVLQYEHNLPAAIESCSKAIESTQGYATASLQRARLRLDQYEELRHGPSRYARSEAGGGTALAEQIRADLKEVQAWSKDEREITFARGALAFVEGRYEEAAQALEDYSKLTLSDYRGWEWTSHAWLHVLGMETRAVSALNEAMKYRPRLPSLFIFRGYAQLQQAIRLKRAMELDKAAHLRALATDDFRAARDMDPMDPGAHCGLGDACLETGEGNLAAVHYSRAIDLNPGYSAAFIGRAWARIRGGDAAGALTDAEESLLLGASDPKAYVARGRARCAQEDLVGAASDLTKALETDPRDAEALIGMGDLKRERGAARDAIDDYIRAIAINPSLAEAFHHRGNAQRDLGNEDAAVSDLSRAMKLDPGNSRIYYDRGVCACNRQEWSDAITDFRKGLARMPSDPWNFWMRIWLARTRLGEREEAAEELASFAGDLATANPEKLSSQIVSLALGRIPVRKFLEPLERLPRGRNERVRAYFYAAERAMTQGDGVTARELLQRCTNEKAVTTSTASTAAAELRLLTDGRRTESRK